MAKYRLLAGQHIQADKDGNSVTFTRGQVVESDVNLVERFGFTKFALIEGSGGEEGDVQSATGNPTLADPSAFQAPTSFPGGQVGTGLQSATSTKDGVTISGPAAPTHAQSRKEQQERASSSGQDMEKEGTAPSMLSSQKEEQHVKNLQQEVQTGRAAGTSTTPTQAPNFEQMSLADLRKYAEDNEVDVKGARTREEYVRALKATTAKK